MGIVDVNQCLSLLQHSTHLYLVNHAALGYVAGCLQFDSIERETSSEELFYQLGLRQFGNMSKLKLEPPPPLKALVTIAVQAEQLPDKTPLNKDQIIDVSALLSK